MTQTWPHNSPEIMRRRAKHMNDPESIRAVLREVDVIHLGMSDGTWPYVTPVNFVLEEDRLYIHSARKGRKMEILSANPRVCFQAESRTALSEPADMDDACQYGMRFLSVMGFGTAAIHTDRPTLEHGLHALMARYSSRQFTFPEAILDKTAMIVVSIEVMTGKCDGCER